MAESVFSQYLTLYRKVGGKRGQASRVTHFRRTMAEIMPWDELETRLEPHYHTRRIGRRPIPLGIMLRLHVLQRIHNYSDQQAVDVAADSLSAMAFCGIDITADSIPDRSVLTRFRHWLDELDFENTLTKTIDQALAQSGWKLTVRKTASSTLIKSTKVASKTTRDDS